MRGNLKIRVFVALMRLPRFVMRGVVWRRPRRGGVTLDLATAFLLRLYELSGGERLGLPLPVQRREMDVLSPAGGGAPREVSVEERELDVDSRKIGIRIYRPHGLRGTAPIIVYYHGGGWVLGSLASHDSACRRLADDARSIVVSVDYRLAPEHPFPSAVEDALAAFRKIAAEASALGGDPGAIAVAGDSAGGNLAAVVAQVTAKEVGARPVFQLLLYPVTDLSKETESYVKLATGFYLTRERMHWFRDRYLRSTADRVDPRASPLLASDADLAGVAPALVVTAGFDVLHDEGHAYAERLRHAGVRVMHADYGTLIHGFFNMAGIVPAADRATSDIAARVRAALLSPS